MFIIKHKPTLEIENAPWFFQTLIRCVHALDVCVTTTPFLHHIARLVYTTNNINNSKSHVPFHDKQHQFFYESHLCDVTSLVWLLCSKKLYNGWKQYYFALIWFWPTKFSPIVLQILFHHGLFRACNMLIL